MSYRYSAAIVGFCALTLSTGMVCAQDYPNKPIRFIASGVGGGSDFTARLVAQGIAPTLGQSVIVENRPGIPQGEIVAKAPPDGYTILMAGGNVFITPLLQKAPYDPEKDFAAISVTDISPNILVVHPSLPVKNVKELIALAKARPGQLNYGSTAPGGSIHLASELFKSMAGVNIVNIPYKATGLAVNDVIAGQTQMIIATALGVLPQVKSGRLHALGVTSAQPSALAPGIPTIASSGLPGYEAIGITGAYAPVKTSAAIITRLNQEIVRFLNTPKAKEQFLAVGGEVAASTVDQAAASLKAEMARWGKVIRDNNIRVE